MKSSCRSELKPNSSFNMTSYREKFNRKMKDSSIDSNVLSNVDTNFKSYGSSPKIKRPHSSQNFLNKSYENLNISSFVDNLKILEGLICEIKSRGFDRTKQDILEKVKLKKELENHVDILKKKKNTIGQQNKNFSNNLSKLTNETKSYGMLKERISKEVYYQNIEVPQMMKDIEDLKKELFFKKNSTTGINSEVLQLEKNNNLCKDEISKMNKEITDLQKEKENAKNSILLLKRHILIMKEKILTEDSKSREFLSNVSTMLDKGSSNTKSKLKKI